MSRRTNLALRRLPQRCFSDDSTCCGFLVVSLVDWLFTLVSDLILTGWLLLIDWSTCLRSAALYRASGNRYFPFAHGPLNLSTPVPKSVTPIWATYPSRTAFNRYCAHCCRAAGSRDACRPPVCRSTAFLLPVHSSRQSPRSVEFRYSLSHTALLLCPPSLHSLIIRFLVFRLSCSPSLVSNLSCSPSLVSKLSLVSSPRRYYANSPRNL